MSKKKFVFVLGVNNLEMQLHLCWIDKIVGQNSTTKNTLWHFFSIDDDECESIFNI